MASKWLSPLVIAVWFTVNSTDSGLAFELDSAVISDGEQLVPESSQPRRRITNGSGRVYRNRVAPNWNGDNTKFWYRNDLPDRGQEFVLVDAVEGKREPAFDHEAVAAALGEGTAAFQLPIESLEFDAEGELTAFVGNGMRRVEDGELICILERADLSELESEGWNAPERFAAKGRDGQTDIWGIICRPRDYDPSRKYPVLEDIYTGPHGSFVPKSFSPSTRFDTLTSLGFIIVKIDGMGTANRSKAFHDVCWKNLKDGGEGERHVHR